MSGSEWSNLKAHELPGKYARPNQEGLLRTKAYIDERARREWREKYGAIHEDYVTVQTQVFLDDAGDVTIVMPRYHPPGVASSSMYSGDTPLISIPAPGLSPADHFHCNLTQSIRTEALSRASDIEQYFDTQLWWVFHNAVARGSDPERKKLGHTPASLYGCPKKTFYVARDIFKNRVKQMCIPQHFKYGIWGLENLEVDIVKGIIFVRFITGWWERDQHKLAETRLAETKGKESSAQSPRSDVDTLHDDLDA